MLKFNPFTPNSPVHKGMFVGRALEIETLDQALTQTKNANPAHLLLLGERGIGKTSLLNLAQMFSNGDIEWNDDEKHNFLTVRISLDENTTLIDFALNLKRSIEREIQKENPELKWFQKTWDFLTRFEVGGISYRKEEISRNNNQLIQEFIYSLVDTVKQIRSGVVSNKKEGLVILVDEADKASKDLPLGSFLKTLSEMIISENQNYILFVLSGLPNLRDVLLQSHESSLRLFQEIFIEPLSKKETALVVQKGLNEAAAKNKVKYTIDEEAEKAIYIYSEGYPHFVQQIAYSVFDIDDDNKIEDDDVTKGFFMKRGALEQIGVRYYVKPFYTDITVDSQRNILLIMSENWNNWVSREEIKKGFSGKEQELNNGIAALIRKGIIIPKMGAKGQYRLQWRSFAFWIKNHKRGKQHRR